MWGPKGQQVMIPTPMQPTRRYGLGAVNWHSGQWVVLTRFHKRRREVAELLEAFLPKHSTETVYVAWDNASTHEDDEIEAVLCAAAGRLVLLYLPTYSPWLNPIEMLWRQFRREVTHCELFASIDALVESPELVLRKNVSECHRAPGSSFVGGRPQRGALSGKPMPPLVNAKSRGGIHPRGVFSRKRSQ
ncbi:transposase [Methylobacterium sp. P31]